MELESNSVSGRSDYAVETSPLLIEDNLGNGDGRDKRGKQLGIRVRLRQDPEFRHKYIKSCWIFWAFIIYGWMVGQLGAALPDLQLIIQTDLQTVSLLITGGGIGLPIGALLTGMIYNNVNTNGLLAFTLLGCVAVTATLPWCPTFAGMLTICVFFGIFKGGLEISGNAAIATMWRMEGRSYMQALHFMFSAGGVLSPFVTGLFLIPKKDSAENNTSIGVANVVTNTTVNIQPATHDAFDKVTRFRTYNQTETVDSARDDIKVQYSYVITSVLALSAAIPFVIMYFTEKGYFPIADTPPDLKHDMNRKVITSPKLRRLCVAISAGVLFFYAGVELSCFSFLTTFCLEYFHWTKTTSSVITSVFWFTFSLGRFSGIFLVRYITPGQILFTFLTAMVLSTLGMLVICVAKLDYLMWVFVSIVGYVLSTVWASLLSWVGENVTPITGRVASLVVVAAMCGQMINPILFGYFMQNVSLLTFVFIPLVENMFCLILFTINHIIVAKHAQLYSELK